MTVAELRSILIHLQQVYAAAGAKGPAKDFQELASLLESFGGVAVANFVAELSTNLSATSNKAKARTRPALNVASKEDAIALHVAKLRSAGTEQMPFDKALGALVEDKSLKVAEVAEIARRYANSVTKYRSLDAARADIAAAFIRRARFENKLK